MSCSDAATRLKQLRKITVLKMNSRVHVVFLLLPFILLCESGLEFVVYHFQNTSWRLSFAYKVDYSLRSVSHPCFNLRGKWKGTKDQYIFTFLPSKCCLKILPIGDLKMQISFMKETSQHESQHENIDFKAVKLNIGNGQNTTMS